MDRYMWIGNRTLKEEEEEEEEEDVPSES